MAPTPLHIAAMDDVRPPIQRIERLTPLADVLARLDRAVEPLPPRELPLREALGRVLAADFRSGVQPPEALALRDGFAVRSDETSGAGAYAPAPLSLAHRIEVGERLPAGADAVLAFDACDEATGSSHALAPVAPGEGVLQPGQDADGSLLRAGTLLRSVDLAILAALGMTRVAVRAPIVRIMNSRTGTVAQAIASMLTGLVAPFAGCELREVFDGAALAAPGADFLILVGGSGSGERDRSVRALAGAGRVEVHGIGLSPGATAAVGFVGSMPVVIVPGRLDATLAVWHVLGGRVLRRLCARAEPLPLAEAKLARKIASCVGIAEFVPVCHAGDTVMPLASGYLPWRTLIEATGYVLVPAASEGFAAGAVVPVMPL
jgi:molybdopterin molybdotransferase